MNEAQVKKLKHHFPEILVGGIVLAGIAAGIYLYKHVPTMDLVVTVSDLDRLMPYEGSIVFDIPSFGTYALMALTKED